MSQIIYRERKQSSQRETTLYPFIYAIVPLLEDYGVPDVYAWMETYQIKDDRGKVVCREAVLGDTRSAHLEHSAWFDPGSYIYTGDGGYESLRSYDLAHRETGEKLNLYIKISRAMGNADQLELEFTGAASDVEKFKTAVQPALQDWVQRMSDLPF